ncbi:MAG: HEAT repeat domain-containing protein, partial [Gemmataceae bacterium]
LKTWKEKDGSTVSQVQPVGGGPVMLISDSPSPTVTTRPLKDRIGFFGKGSDTTAAPVAPAAAPVAPAPATPPVGYSRPGVFGRVSSRAPSSDPPAGIQPTSGVRQTVPPPLSKDVEPARPADLRQSWGKVEPSATPTRQILPVANRQGGDPLERPDLYTAAPLPTPVSTDAGPRLQPVATPAPTQASTVVSTTVVVPGTPVTGDCKSCQGAATSCGCKACKEKAPCATCQAGGSGRLLDRLRGGRAVVSQTAEGETVIQESKPVVVKEGKPIVVKERPVRMKETVVKEAPAKESLPRLISPLPRNDGRIGVFAGLNTPQPAPARTGQARRDPSLPRGMGSAAAAGSPGVDAQTQLGALVRQPDGSTAVVPASQIDPRVASVPVAASNAFTINQSSIPYVAMTPDQAANAWSMATPTRPVPADMGSVPVIPNGLQAYGMGGADGRPALAMAGHYHPGYHYPAPMAGYYLPQAMGYYGYPAQPMLHPGALLPAGTAVVSDRSHPVTSHAMAALRSSVMPSERERAAEALAQANWKADPQVVPALVTAAQSDPAPMVRVCCLRALKQMKANTVPAVEAVKACREDRDARVRQEAGRCCRP